MVETIMYLDLSGAPDALAYLLVDVFYRALRTLPRKSGWSSRAAIERASQKKGKPMYRSILIPVVLGEGHDHTASFEVARRLAHNDASFTILHVRQPIPAFVAAEIPDTVLEDTRQECQVEVKKIADTLPGSKPVIQEGHAGRAIVDYADAHSVDCIVLASHKPGLQNLFLGSTANRVVHHAKCAVHVIR